MFKRRKLVYSFFVTALMSTFSACGPTNEESNDVQEAEIKPSIILPVADNQSEIEETLVLGKIKPTFYYAPMSCKKDAMEGISICRRDGASPYVLDYLGKRHPLWVPTKNTNHASKVLNIFGSRDNTLTALRSIAMDSSFPNDKTRLYLPNFDGKVFALYDMWVDKNGNYKEGYRKFVHDGCFIKADTGGAFKNKGKSRIDIYVGLKQNYVKFLSGDWNNFNSAQNGTWNSSRCASVGPNFKPSK